MKIGIAADHKGYVIKQMVKAFLITSGHEAVDFGATHLVEHDDYIDFIIPLAMSLHRRELQRGIAIFANGNGACIMANKIKGVRAALISDHFNAHQVVEENDANLLCLAATVLNYVTIKEFIQLFLDAQFEGDDRDHHWMKKVIALESTNRFLYSSVEQNRKR